MTSSIQDIQSRLWGVADQLRANSELTLAEYKSPVLGLVFLRFVDQKFSAAKEQLESQQGPSVHNAGFTSSLTCQEGR